MPLIDDGVSLYTIGPNGEKQHGHGTEFKMNDDIVYQMNEASGVLKICVSQEDAQKLTQLLALPSKEIILPTPLGQEMHFFNVQKLESISAKDGTFLLRLS